MGLVSKIQQLVDLSPQGADWLSGNIETFSYKKNEKVFQEGRVCNYLYYIQEGMAGGYYMADEQEVCNWIATEDDFATAYYSFISRKPSYESIECFEACTIQAMSHTVLYELYLRYPETERAGRLILEEYYSRLEERLLSIQFKAAKERYTQLCDKRPEIIRRAPLGRIATYLGMKQETLSRIRAEK